MENVSFNLAQLHEHGSAFYNFLKLRKRFFVDKLGWDIPHDDDVEMDQYDNPTAYYSLVVRDGDVVAGIRAMPTTAKWGNHTYMLRDAVAGRLSGIPEDIIPEATAAPAVWEATRVVISEELTTHAERSTALAMILNGVVEKAKGAGASEIIALCPPSFARTLRQIGYQAKIIGDPYVNDHDGRRYVAMSMPAEVQPVVTMVPPTARPTHMPSQQPVHAPSVI